MINQIPDVEYEERVSSIRKILEERGIDLLIVFGSESEPQNLIYLSNYWPAFETACVLIPVEGDPVLVIGPESMTFAQDYSKIKKICRVLEHRESAEPSYPDANLDTYEEIINELIGNRKTRKIALCGFHMLTFPVYQLFRKIIGEDNIINGDDILLNIRIKKSENELILMKKSAEITMKGFEAVLNNVKPGMEEVEVAGYVVEAMFKNNAENLAYTPYILSGRRTRLAIGRASHKKINRNEPLTFDCGCRYGNYSSSLGRSFCIGKMKDDYKRLVKVGIELQKIIIDSMKVGISAAAVFKKYWSYIDKHGYSKYFLFGPCHGTGVMECEHPFLEADSDYELFEGLTFQVNIFLICPDFGIKFENGVVIRKGGVEEFSPSYREVIEL